MIFLMTLVIAHTSAMALRIAGVPAFGPALAKKAVDQAEDS